MLTVKCHTVNVKRKAFARVSISVMSITFSLSVARQIRKPRKPDLFGPITGKSSIKQDSMFIKYDSHIDAVQ